MSTIEKYLHNFVSLNTATIAGKKAPHKAVLLLAIMDLIADGTIATNHIVLSDELVLRFGQIWEQYIQADAPFQQKVVTPYWHLKSEPFYHLYFTDRTPVTDIDNPYSVSKLRELVYASLDEDLFGLIKTESSREELSVILIINYLEPVDVGKASAKKNIRLSKAARELNMSLKVLSDYLNKKGFVVNSSPNQKINASQYEMLIKAFSKNQYE